jgi:hypothetical protein
MREWLRARAAGALQGELAWVVVADLAQGAWLRRRAVEEDIALLGVRFLTAGALRRELGALLGEECRLLGRESLEFLLKLEAMEHTGAEAGSVALDPGQCLAALDDLARAGWSGEEADLGEVPSPAREWLRVLAGSGAWAPEIDRQLKRKGGKLERLHLCFWAWDWELGTERSLLAVALTVTNSAVFFLPSPLEDLEFNWVLELEELCGVTAEVCGESGFVSAHEELAERLFRKGEALTVTRVPDVLVGETERDELALLEREVWRGLADCCEGGQIGVVFPARSVLSRLLAGRLSAAGVPLFDHIGNVLPADWSAEVQRKLAAYYLYGCQVDDFLSLMMVCGKVEPMRLRRELKELFRWRQTRSVPELLVDADGEAGKLARALGVWRERAEWLELKADWQRVARLVGGSTECLEPLWSRLDMALAGRTIKGRAFLEYVIGLLRASRTGREGAEVFAKVEIVTLRQAAGRVWRHLIFAESNEGRSPLPVRENPFLPDVSRVALNRRRGADRGWLFTTGERALLEDKRLRDVLENCDGTAVFTASAFDGDRALYPNGLVSQLLASRGGVLGEWRRLTVSVGVAAGADGEQLDEAEHTRLAAIAENRRDPRRAFDEYSFCYPEQFAEGLCWSATRLEDLTHCSATAALALLFNAEAADAGDFTRNESWFTGTLTHEWIRRYLADGVPPLTMREAQLEEVGAALRRELNVSGLWLETAFRSARWMTGELLAMAYAEGLAKSDSMGVERDIVGVVRTTAGSLRLKGRMDLVLADGAHWRVFDFKTGKADAPTAKALARGDGLQFGAYLLLALSAGAKSATVQCLSPKRSVSRTLTMAETADAEQGLARAALVQRTLRFGISAAKHNNEWCERLPLAQMPIEWSVLAAKARLTFGGGEDADSE